MASATSELLRVKCGIWTKSRSAKTHYAFYWHGLGLLVPLEGRVTNPNPNQYKVIVNDHLYPVMKHFYPDGIGLFQDDNSPSIGHKRSLNGLMSMKIM